MSHVMCHVSHVTCHMSCVTFFFFEQSGEAYRWRVCYQRAPPRLVLHVIHHGTPVREPIIRLITNVTVLLFTFSAPQLITFECVIEKCITISKEWLKKSCIRETLNLSTDAVSSTDAIGGWTKNTPKPNFFEKREKSSKTQKLKNV